MLNLTWENKDFIRLITGFLDFSELYYENI
jgi:hypothetical protein